MSFPTVIRNLCRHKSVAVSLVLIVTVISVAVLAPWVAPHDPNMQYFDGLTMEGAPLPPNDEFLLGTDLLGRDLLSRLIYGAQTSLIIGIVANGIAILIGTLVGVSAGFIRGWTGTILMRLTDLMMAFPALLLAIALAAILQPSIWIVALVIAMVNWVQVARVIYSETIAISSREFIAVERTLGASTLRILFSHLLPHLLPTIMVWATLGISTTVLLEATLSFLGVGVQPPTPSWGNIIFESQTYFTSAFWLVLFPGLAIILLALSFNLVGDALRDELDPSLKGRG
ncbi:peptide ABC transporter permease [Marinobacter vulgaris]|uniref:Peptide ABC transporter permease n=1 Tax=Marinobacter vulgaris TaxID=1928331 RepID=A0A2V3ZUS7_9GAMM|nr:ABC transporter permease [Marinobacter vulgaris]PXX89121.1 peptide ABC transporter permease [Marinobacter vulgaris]TSJ67437.1 ABC transporter permease [Marinobacter vulgaris]